jgi:hypothetical protein
MAQKTVLVCDVCGVEPARTVTLRVVGANWQKDLCEAHLSELLSGARRPRRGARPGRQSPVSAATAATSATKKRAGRRPQAAPRPSRRGGTTRDVTAQAKKLRAGGLSYRQIGEALIKRGIKPPRAKTWNRVVIARMLKPAAA